MESANRSESRIKWFGEMAARTAGWAGSAWAFTIAASTIVVWGASGPYFHYSETWQLVINTATTIITFLMVFLVQNTQNRNDRALQLKLDEVIRSIRSADNEMIDVEELSDDELDRLAKQYHRIREECDARREEKKRMPS